jgi:hypothetical protein
MSNEVTFEFTRPYPPPNEYELTKDTEELLNSDGLWENSQNNSNQQKFTPCFPHNLTTENPWDYDLANQENPTIQKISTIFEIFCVLIVAIGNYTIVPAAIGFSIGGAGGAAIGACIGLSLFTFQMLVMGWKAYTIYKYLSS